MRVVRQPDELRDVDDPIILTIGAFDGVHLGHRALIDLAVAGARGGDGEAWVLTFEPHPLKVLRPEEAPALLTSVEHRLALLKATPLSGCIMMPFTEEVSRWEPEIFLERLAASIPSLKMVIVGENWRFGHRGRGDIQMLQEKAAASHLGVVALGPVMGDGSPISSTRIRSAVGEGQLASVAAMLGRPYSLMGTVREGEQVGRTLGFPTANVWPHNEVKPPPGIYAAYALVDGTRYDAAAYLRSSLTARDPAQLDVVEVHLLGASLDLYTQDMEVCFVEKLRDDRAFESREQALEQITRDVERVRECLGAPTT